MKALFTRIDSDTNQFIKLAKSLLEKKYRDREGLFIVEGLKLIDEALRAGFTLKYLYCCTEKDLSIQAEKIFLITESLMKKIASTETAPELLAIFQKNPLKSASPATFGKVNLYCENLQDPGNLGGIIRTALASGCESIFLDNCVDIFNPKLIRASAGTVFHANLHEINLSDFLKLKESRQEQIYLLGTSPRANYIYYDFKPIEESKIVLMMGNEGQGLSQEAFSTCDTSLSIPINPKVESLNVLAATTVLLFYFQSLWSKL